MTSESTTSELTHGLHPITTIISSNTNSTIVSLEYGRGSAQFVLLQRCHRTPVQGARIVQEDHNDQLFCGRTLLITGKLLTA